MIRRKSETDSYSLDEKRRVALDACGYPQWRRVFVLRLIVMDTDIRYMKRALYLAARAQGQTSPNPLVGAVLVKGSRVIAEGWHKKAGLPHAEVVALQVAGKAARGATLYVNLEPCSHQGRTGPCADALIAAGVKRVFLAVRDPDPRIAGQGVVRLKSAGVEVFEGLLAEQAVRLNEVFFKWMATAQPFVAAKYAMSLDGKIATKTGESQWISGTRARRFAHHLRNCYDGIMVGLGTVLADNPALTCRLPRGRNPLRIIVDSKAGIPLNAQVLRDGLARTIVAVTEEAPPDRVDAIQRLPGVEVLSVPALNGRVDVRRLINRLADGRLTSLLVEGGGMLHASMLAAGLIDKLYAVTAPIIIGGQAALGPVGGLGVERLADAWPVKNLTAKKLGEDILITCYLK